MPVKTIDPETASKLAGQGAVLVDVREPNEHAQETIPGARNAPLSRLAETLSSDVADQPIIFFCRSGMRTNANAAQLAAAAADCEAYIVSGGLNAWKSAGLPVS
jgi:rhodanese-related sulfurtransferase